MPEQQLVEIAKALSKDVRLLILDEPTAALNDNDSAHLLDLLPEARGRCIQIGTRRNHRRMTIAVTTRQIFDPRTRLLVTAATIRTHPAALSPRVKSLNYLNNILARMREQISVNAKPNCRRRGWTA
mgnify:CR=1 FL=1